MSNSNPPVADLIDVVLVRLTGMTQLQAMGLSDWRQSLLPQITPFLFLAAGPSFYSALFKPEDAEKIKAWLVECGWWDDPDE